MVRMPVCSSSTASNRPRRRNAPPPSVRQEGAAEGTCPAAKGTPMRRQRRRTRAALPAHRSVAEKSRHAWGKTRSSTVGRRTRNAAANRYVAAVAEQAAKKLCSKGAGKQPRHARRQRGAQRPQRVCDVYKSAETGGVAARGAYGSAAGRTAPPPRHYRQP